MYAAHLFFDVWPTTRVWSAKGHIFKTIGDPFPRSRSLVSRGTSHPTSHLSMLAFLSGVGEGKGF